MTKMPEIDDLSKFTQAIEQLQSDLAAIQPKREFDKARFLDKKGKPKALEHFGLATRGLELLSDKYHGRLSSAPNSEYSENLIAALSHLLDFVHGMSESSYHPRWYITLNLFTVKELDKVCVSYLKESNFNVIDDKTYRTAIALISFIDKITGHNQTWTLHKMSSDDANLASKDKGSTYNNSYIFDGKNLYYRKSKAGSKLIKVQVSDALKKNILSFNTDLNTSSIALSDSQVTALTEKGAPQPENKCSDELSKLDVDPKCTAMVGGVLSEKIKDFKTKLESKIKAYVTDRDEVRIHEQPVSSIESVISIDTLTTLVNLDVSVAEMDIDEEESKLELNKIELGQKQQDLILVQQELEKHNRLLTDNQEFLRVSSMESDKATEDYDKACQQLAIKNGQLSILNGQMSDGALIDTESTTLFSNIVYLEGVLASVSSNVGKTISCVKIPLKEIKTRIQKSDAAAFDTILNTKSVHFDVHLVFSQPVKIDICKLLQTIIVGMKSERKEKIARLESERDSISTEIEALLKTKNNCLVNKGSFEERCTALQAKISDAEQRHEKLKAQISLLESENQTAVDYIERMRKGQKTRLSPREMRARLKIIENDFFGEQGTLTKHQDSIKGCATSMLALIYKCLACLSFGCFSYQTDYDFINELKENSKGYTQDPSNIEKYNNSIQMINARARNYRFFISGSSDLSSTIGKYKAELEAVTAANSIQSRAV